LEKSAKVDFYMRYFNSDGKESTMCGNGGRCMVDFAHSLHIIGKETRFLATDGVHEAVIRDHKLIALKMQNINSIATFNDHYFIDTGSPHYVRFVDDLDKIPVYEEGRKIRYDRSISQQGTNVNFVCFEKAGHISIRTYERGVENETFACGTGAVASAISAYLRSNTDKTSYTVKVLGGILKVSFDVVTKNTFKNIWLTGPSEYIYQGTVHI